MPAALALIVVGLALLTVGADRMVLAAARWSRAKGISPILVGALVVGFGTSAPEMLVSAFAALRGDLDLAVGNVVGSNVSNLTLVLGATALVRPLAAPGRVVAREGLAMLAAVGGLAAVLWDLQVDRAEAAVLAAGMAMAILLLVRWGDATGLPAAVEPATPVGRREVAIGVAALAMTLAGAEVLVRGADRLVLAAGIEAAFVGLVVVAVGTSLPELATSLAAARRGESDLVVGNVIGSNLFNSLAVAGMAGLIAPAPIDNGFGAATAFMLAATAVAAVFAVTGRRVARAEGALLLASFGVFVVAVA